METPYPHRCPHCGGERREVSRHPSRPEHDRYICNQCGKCSRRYQGTPLEHPDDPKN